MRKFACSFVSLVLLLSLGLHRPTWHPVYAQDADTIAYAGLGYGIDYPSTWSARSFYVTDGVFTEVTFLMPTPVPDLPPYTTQTPLLKIFADISADVAPGFWLSELTAQPVVAILNMRYSSYYEYPIDEFTQLIQNAFRIWDLSYGPVTPITLNGVEGLATHGTVAGERGLTGITFEYQATAIAHPGQTIIAVGFAAQSLFAVNQALLDTIIQSLRFEASPTLDLPDYRRSPNYENQMFSIEIPAYWHLYSDDFQATIAQQSMILYSGQSLNAAIALSNPGPLERFHPRPGEGVIWLKYARGPVRGGPHRAESWLVELNGRFPITPLDAAFYALPNDADHFILQFRGTTEHYEVGVYTLSYESGAFEREGIAVVFVFAAPGEVVDSAAAYTLLTTLTPRHPD